MILRLIYGGLIGGGLAVLTTANGRLWIWILGILAFFVGLSLFINQEIDDAKEDIKREILDEVEEILNK